MNRRKKKKQLSKQQEYIFGAIGYIFYMTSMIEYNLVQVIAAERYLQVFDKEDLSYIDVISAKEDSNRTLHELTDGHKMLGKLIDILEKDTSIDGGLIERLRKVADIRGYYAHQFYKEDLYKNYLEKTPLIYRKQLREDVGFIYSVHMEVFGIDKANRALAKRTN